MYVGGNPHHVQHRLRFLLVAPPIPLLLPASQPNPTPAQPSTSYTKLLPPLILIPSQDLKPLHQPYNNIHSLRQRKVLPNTHPRAPRERHKRPPRPEPRLQPSLRPKHV